MSVTTRPSLQDVLDEPAMDLLWPRAALMQIADAAIAPTEVISGVYGNRGAQRWQGTMTYLRLVAGSDDESIALLVREVNRLHARVRVPGGSSGRRRPVFESTNQAWVAASWFQSLIDTYRLLIGPIDDDWLDVLLADFGRVGGILQMRTGDWPVGYPAFSRYVRAQEMRYPVHLPRSPRGADPEQYLPGDVAAQVFSTYSLPRGKVARMPVVRLLSWGMAGEVLREVYETPWTSQHQQRFESEADRLRRRQLRRPAGWRRRPAVRQRRRVERALREHSAQSPPGRAGRGGADMTTDDEEGHTR